MASQKSRLGMRSGPTSAPRAKRRKAAPPTRYTTAAQRRLEIWNKINGRSRAGNKGEGAHNEDDATRGDLARAERGASEARLDRREIALLQDEVRGRLKSHKPERKGCIHNLDASGVASARLAKDLNDSGATELTVRVSKLDTLAVR